MSVRALKNAVAISSLFAVASVAAPLSAQSPEGTPQSERSISPHPEATDAIGKIRSPYCPGLMLEVCPSPNAADLRDSIEAWAELGATSDSIVEAVIATYGEEWRALPPAAGTGLWAWLTPPLYLAGCLLVVGVVLRAARGGREAVVPIQPPSDGDLARIQKALHELDEAEGPDW